MLSIATLVDLFREKKKSFSLLFLFPDSCQAAEKLWSCGKRFLGHKTVFKRHLEGFQEPYNTEITYVTNQPL